MSNQGTSPSVGSTIARGIQDVSAFLPLIGTEQCEKQTGSALTRGYLYAAAAPLSIFGSLGIVKAGISILICSISISILNVNVSISLHDLRLSFRYSGQREWLGGRMLKDAGFELVCAVAPHIGMDGDRYKTETWLIEILKEKCIDDPQKITVDWKSREWNMMFVVSTIFADALGIKLPFSRPRILAAFDDASTMAFPALRIVGSCFATVACQLIIQARVISIVKNRNLFMLIHRPLNTIYKDGLNVWLKDSKLNLNWESSLPVEQCLWTVRRYFSSVPPLSRRYQRKIRTELQITTPCRIMPALDLVEV